MYIMQAQLPTIMSSFVWWQDCCDVVLVQEQLQAESKAGPAAQALAIVSVQLILVHSYLIGLLAK